MVVPLNDATACSKRLLSSCSSSSSVQSVSGFLAPPCSTFLDTRRHRVSNNLFLAELPGGES